MKKHQLTAAVICLILMTFLFVACKQSEKQPEFQCPFSSLNWDSTVANMVSLEGESKDTYKSVYGGICYTYPKTFNEKAGTIKYMFDDTNRLMCIAWAYSSEESEELYAIYNSINQSVNDTYGESNYNTDKQTNYGNVWYLEDGSITLSTMITTSNKALQYAYIRPDTTNQD